MKFELLPSEKPNCYQVRIDEAPVPLVASVSFEVSAEDLSSCTIKLHGYDPGPGGYPYLVDQGTPGERVATSDRTIKLTGARITLIVENAAIALEGLGVE